ncbi:MAG TPA: response regulator, partial [Holophaga sp.]|nr:response regulator [Holophaga sp.]
SALSGPTRAKAWQQVQRTKEQRSFHFSDTVLRSDGSTRDIDVFAIKLDQGGRSLLLTTLFDQTEWKAAQQALAESEARFRELADSTPMMIWTSGLDAGCDYFNKPWLEFRGRTMAEEAGNAWAEGVFPEDLERCLAIYRTAFDLRQPFEMEYRLQRHDGQYRWVFDKGLPRRSERGDFVGYVGAVLDITDRKEAEGRIARLAAAVEQVAEAIAITDAAGTIAYVNRSFSVMTGFDPDSARDWELSNLLDHPDIRKAVACAMEGGMWEGRLKIHLEPSKLRDLDITCSPVRDLQDRIVNLVVVLRDSTMEVEFERQLRQSQKMDALGALAAGVAHDFNNVLTTILTASQLLKTNLPDDSRLQTKVDAILQAGLCAAGLTKQILSFSHKSEEKRLPLDMSSVVKSTLKMLRSTQPIQIQIASEVSSGIWVEGDPALLHQVVLNLAINAFHAMEPKGGTLQVSLAELALDGELDLPEGRYALLQVKDTGCGMSPATLEKIFDPFFTTKPTGVGTGLGLSVVHATVAKAGGRIQVQSQEGVGTTFRIYWPCVTASALPAGGEPAEDVRGAEALLYVDDEELVSALAKLGLQELGYSVSARTNPVEALAEFREHPAAFDLVFTDLAMAELNGADLAAQIHEIRSDIPIVLVSGLPMAATLSLGARARFQGVVAKPFTPHDLAQAARKVFRNREAVLPPGPSAQARVDGSRNRRSACVLLAEDSHTTRAMIRTWLEKAGYDVRVAQDGMAAWDLFTNGPDHGRFDLLLTDVVMPRLDGLELTQLVRRSDPALPIAILTSNEDKDTVKSALHLGVDQFLNKPFEAKELLACVEKLLTARASRVAEQRSRETAQAVRIAQRTMVAMPEKGLPL